MARRDHTDLPMLARANVAQFQPSTVNDDSRTIEVTWTTGARVRRSGWDGEYDEELSLDDGAVRLARLNGGAPLLDSHNSRAISSIIGRVERAWLSKRPRDGRAVIRFSERADVEPIWRDVKAGIISNISVGYAVHRAEMVERKNDVPLMRALDWEPMELSMVPIPADAGAKVRADGGTYPCVLDWRDDVSKPTPEAAKGAAEESKTEVAQKDGVKDFAGKMNSEQKDPAPETRADPPKAKETRAEAAPPAPTEDEIRRRIQSELEADRERAEAIRHATKLHKLEPEVGERLIRTGVSVGVALRTLLDTAFEREQALEAVKGPVRVASGEQDEEDVRGKAIRSAILHRYAPSVFRLEFGGERYVGRTLLELGRHCLESAHVNTDGMSRTEVARRAMMPGYGVRSSGLHTTSDYVNVLADVANKTLRASYDQAVRTFLPFTRRTTAPDFKSINRVQLGEAPQLLAKNEHGEFVRGTIGDAKETYVLVTYGRVFGITREVIINDDLDAFTRIPSLFGNAAAQKESDVVWAVLTANAAMSDGTALFHANHGNLAGSGAAISVTTIGAGRQAMRNQKGLDGTTLINVQPAFLIVPAALETVAEQFLSATLTPAQTSNVVPESLRRSLSLIVEPRLDAVSATAWYLAGNPASIDTIEYAFLEGEEGVMIDSRVGFDIDGVEVRARLDFGAKAIDHRGLYRNAGA